ncbi:hypothetical protein RND81_03G222900 [Saponaria officinalis]
MSKLPRNCLTALKLDHLVPLEQQVFDEIPVPNSPVCVIDLCQNQDGAPISDTHQVFDKKPVLNSPVCAIDLCQNQDGALISDAHQVLDEKPVLDFILEMAQDAKNAQGIQSHPPSNTISNCPANAELEFKKSKFGSIDERYDAKLLSAPKMLDEMSRSTIDKDLAQDDPIKENYKSALKMLDDHDDFSKYELCKVNSSSKLSQVKTETFAMSRKIHSTHFIANVVRQFSISDMNWSICLSLSMVLGVEMEYNIRVFEMKIGWMTYIDFKEILSWGTIV